MDSAKEDNDKGAGKVVDGSKSNARQAPGQSKNAVGTVWANIRGNSDDNDDNGKKGNGNDNGEEEIGNVEDKEYSNNNEEEEEE